MGWDSLRGRYCGGGGVGGCVNEREGVKGRREVGRAGEVGGCVGRGGGEGEGRWAVFGDGRGEEKRAVVGGFYGGEEAAASLELERVPR